MTDFTRDPDLYNATRPGPDNPVRIPDAAMLPDVSSAALSAGDPKNRATAEQTELGQMPAEWTERVRRAVRGNPLMAVATALAVGVFVARITR